VLGLVSDRLRRSARKEVGATAPGRKSGTLIDHRDGFNLTAKRNPQRYQRRDAGGGIGVQGATYCAAIVVIRVVTLIGARRRVVHDVVANGRGLERIGNGARCSPTGLNLRQHLYSQRNQYDGKDLLQPRSHKGPCIGPYHLHAVESMPKRPHSGRFFRSGIPSHGEPRPLGMPQTSSLSAPHLASEAIDRTYADGAERDSSLDSHQVPSEDPWKRIFLGQ